MFSLKNIFNNLLTENRVEFLKNKLAGEGKSLTEKEFNSLLSIDPTTNKEFLQWIIREYLKLDDEEKKRFIREDKDIIKNDLTIYQKVKNKIPVEQRDINKYSFAAFADFITKFYENNEITSSKKELLDRKYKVFENDNYIVYKFSEPTETDYKMSCEVNSGTRWCTRPSYEKYKYYLKNDKFLMIFIDKNNPENKFQWNGGADKINKKYLTQGQFMDKNDQPIPDRFKFFNKVFFDGKLKLEDFLNKDFLKKSIEMLPEGVMYYIDHSEDMNGLKVHVFYIFDKIFSIIEGDNKSIMKTGSKQISRVFGGGYFTMVSMSAIGKNLKEYLYKYENKKLNLLASGYNIQKYKLSSIPENLNIFYGNLVKAGYTQFIVINDKQIKGTIKSFSNNIFYITKERYGQEGVYVDLNGKMVYGDNIVFEKPFDDKGTAKVYMLKQNVFKDISFIINKKGEKVISGEFNYFHPLDNENRLYVAGDNNKNNKGIFDVEKNTFITPQIFYSIEKFKKGLAYATIQNKDRTYEEFWITKSGRILSDDDLMENYKR